MLRTIAQIIAAIMLTSPKMPDVKANEYATYIQQKANEVDIDPFTYVTIIAHESDWNERAISADHKDYGLMQVRAEFYKDNPIQLLNGIHNIRVASFIINANKNFCRRHLKREPLMQEWLSCYHGSCWRPENLCKATPLTKIFEDHQKCIESDILNNTNSNCMKIFYPNKK